MNMPEPKLFNSLPDESSLRTGARVEPAQLSYENGEAPGGMSGFAPHRSATQTDSPSLSIATPFRAPHFLPSGSFPHGAMVWYGLGRSLVGWISPAGVAQAPHSVIAAIAGSGNDINRHADTIGPLLASLDRRYRDHPREDVGLQQGDQTDHRGASDRVPEHGAEDRTQRVG